MHYSGLFARKRLFQAVLLGLVVCLGTAPSVDAAKRHHRHAVTRVQRSGGGDDLIGSPRYAAYVVDDKSGRVLYAKNADAPRHPASLTKMMTLYLLFEDMKKGKVTLATRFTVSRHAASQAPSKLGFRPGQTIPVEDAIRAIVTKSANDVAVTIAENLGGSEDAFARRMTQTARRIGMRGSTFYNASGLPNAQQYTTARDMVTLGRALQERYPTYYRYFSTRSFAWGDSVYPNHNNLLYRLEGIDGIKTGYTDASGFNLVSSLRRDNRHLVAAVMGGSSARSRDDHMMKLLTTHLAEASTGGKMSSVFTENDVADAGDTADSPETSVLGYAEPTPPPAQPPRQAAAETVAMAVETAKPVDLVRSSAAKPSNAPRIASSDQIPMPRSEPSARPSTDHGAAVAMARAILLPDSGRATTITETQRPQARQTAAEVRSAPVPESVRTEPDRRAHNEPVRVKTASISVTPPIARLTSDASDTSTGSVPRRRGEEPAPAPKSEARTGWLVQIGAYDRESAARAALTKARDRLGGSLGRLDDVVEGVPGNSGRLWRARFAGLKDQKSADAACKVLRRKDFACLALRQ